jgi:hypothetical protein
LTVKELPGKAFSIFTTRLVSVLSPSEIDVNSDEESNGGVSSIIYAEREPVLIVPVIDKFWYQTA